MTSEMGHLVPHPKNHTRSGSPQAIADAASSVAQIVPDYSGSLRPCPARLSRPESGVTSEMEH
jgi:hypothetical protein